jgi:hypothetical protein
MKTKSTLFAVLISGALLTACASPGTRVSTTSDAYKDMAKSQQAWCGTFSDSCACSIDGNKTTCSLVYACVNSGNCKAAP